MLPGAGVLNADSGGLAKLDGFAVAAGEVYHAVGEVAAVVFFDGDIERASELAGTGEVGVPIIQRLGGADKHRLRVAGRAGDDVEHVVHAVDEVDIGVTCGAEHDFGARGATFGGMTGEVVGADVGFGFDDSGAALCMGGFVNEDRADEVGGDLLGVSGEEGSGSFFMEILRRGATLRLPAPGKRG